MKPAGRSPSLLLRFLQSEAAGGVVLMLAAALAMVLANGSLADAYFHLLHAETGPVLSDKLVEGHALACGDLLKLDEDQIIVGWRGGGGGVRMYTWTPAAFAQWRESVVDNKGMACEDLCLADLDGDRKLDIIASGRATKNVVIYWNESSPTAPTTSPATAPGR